MNPSLESMLDPERLAQPLPGAIYLASPYTAQDPGVEQARVQAVKHVSGRLIREGQGDIFALGIHRGHAAAQASSLPKGGISSTWPCCGAASSCWSWPCPAGRRAKG